MTFASGSGQENINLIGRQLLFLLQNVAGLGPFVVNGVGVPFSWDSPPLIDDAGDWSRVNSTDIRCNRAGRYEIEYSIAGSTAGGDPAAYVAAFADLNGTFLDPSLAQFQVGSADAVTFIMSFVLPSVTVGQVLRILLAAAPNVNFFAGAGAQLSIGRLR